MTEGLTVAVNRKEKERLKGNERHYIRITFHAHSLHEILSLMLTLHLAIDECLNEGNYVTCPFDDINGMIRSTES